MRIKFQHIVNIASALIVFIGGMIILFYFSGNLSIGIRVAIGVFVTLYSALRAGQTYRAIMKDANRSHSLLEEASDIETEKKRRPKSP